MSKLAILEKKLPLRAYPEKELDNVLETTFKMWLAELLSIKADNEEKLDAALPAIKKHFWSLGIVEVKKAFEMYADSQMSIKPVSNYFDRILVGQIFKEYRELKPKPKPVKIGLPEISEEEKKNVLANGALRLFNEYKDLGMVFPGNSHIYDYLTENGFIKPSEKFWRENETEAKLNLKRSKNPLMDKQAKKIVVPKSSETEIQSETKRIILEKYFESKLKTT